MKGQDKVKDSSARWPGFRGGLHGRPQKPDSDGVTDAGHDPKWIRERRNDHRPRRAYSTSETGSDHTERHGSRRQRPEEDREVSYAAVRPELHVVHDLNVLATDPCPSHEEAGTFVAQFVSVLEILEDIENHSRQATDLVSAIEGELLGQRRVEHGISRERIGDRQKAGSWIGLRDQAGRRGVNPVFLDDFPGTDLSEPRPARERWPREGEIGTPRPAAQTNVHAHTFRRSSAEGMAAPGRAYPFELRDIGMVKLFFADALDHTEAQALLRLMLRRSEGYLATFRTIVPEAERLAQGGNAHPLLTLRMGIAFHQAIIEVCGDFAKDSTRGRRVR